MVAGKIDQESDLVLREQDMQAGEELVHEHRLGLARSLVIGGSVNYPESSGSGYKAGTFSDPRQKR